MSLVRLVLIEYRSTRLWLWLATIAAALGPVAALAIINKIISEAISDEADLSLISIYVLAVVVLIIGNLVAVRICGAIVERVIEKYRAQLQRDIVRLDYSDFVSLGGSIIYDSITRNSSILSDKGAEVARFLTIVGTLFFSFFYILYISWIILIVYAVIFSIGAIFIVMSRRVISAAYSSVDRADEHYLSLLRQLINGFSEVRLHRRRAEDLLNNHLAPASEDLLKKKLHINLLTSRSMALFQGVTWGTIGLAAFVFPVFMDDGTLVVQAIYVGVFLRGYLMTMIAQMPVLTRAETAFKELQSLAASLLERVHDNGTEAAATEFERIKLQKVGFSYPEVDGAPGFKIGPIDLEIQRGEVLFVIGANGAGKSTLLRLLCYLDQPMTGLITVDGKPVNTENCGSYRSMFSAVFTEFHVFDQLFGLSDVDDMEANLLLDEFGLGEKVRVESGIFSTTDLSSGQRQRLALAVAILEHRPIVVLDEVAADQDPDFRDRIYKDLIPRWKEEGRTLIVVSHDSRYFESADRMIKLTNGVIESAGD